MSAAQTWTVGVTGATGYAGGEVCRLLAGHPNLRLAGVHANCRQGWQVLATSADNESADSVQAFELPDREPIAISKPLALNGRITALWTAQDGENAIAVFRNSETGNYEAALLNFTCSQ